MKIFRPTYLYIKRHLITGKLYFGKTTGTEKYLLEEYNGSGDYWRDHLRIHGTQVETIWYCLFYDKEELSKFALMCSNQWNIVKEEQWANEKPENGLDGGPQSEESNARQSQAKKGIKKGPQSEEHKIKRGEKVSEAVRLGRHPCGQKISCPCCGKEGQKTAMYRWHFDNCKDHHYIYE